MSELQQFKGLLFDLPEAQFERILDMKNRLQQIVSENGGEGLVALAWIGLEYDGAQVTGVDMLKGA